LTGADASGVNFTAMEHKKEKKTRGTVLRALADREAKIQENPKTGLFIKGHKTSQIVNDALRDLCALKKPDSKKYNKKKRNSQTTPFEDETTIEFFSTKNDASLFMFGSHSKKRQHNLIIGRLFNYHILDMFEFGVSDFKSITHFRPTVNPMLGSKPCFSVIGSLFQTDSRYQTAANLLVDFFRGKIVKDINLQGLDRVITLAVGDAPDTISFRHYAIKLLKSGSHVPTVDLEEVGPSFTLTMRRTRFASTDLRKASLKQPKEAKAKKQKNVSTNAMHDKVANVHIANQHIDKVTVGAKKPKAVRTHGKRLHSELSHGSTSTVSPSKKQRT